MIFNRTRLRCRRILEHLFRVQSAEVFESVVECWSRDEFVSMHYHPKYAYSDFT